MPTERQQNIDLVVDSLEHRLGSDLDHGKLAAAVELDFLRFSEAPIQDFVPVLVEKDIHERLIERRRGADPLTSISSPPTTCAGARRS